MEVKRGKNAKNLAKAGTRFFHCFLGKEKELVEPIMVIRRTRLVGVIVGKWKF